MLFEVKNNEAELVNSFFGSKEKDNPLLAYELFLKQGYWEYHSDSDSCYFSSGIYKIFECDLDSVSENLQRVIREMMECVGIEELEVYINEDSCIRKEFEIVDGLGKKKRIEVFGKILPYSVSGHKKYIGVIRDISQLKDYEKDLKLKIDELNRSNRELEEFVHIASHDLYEPLRKISTFGQRLFSDAQNEMSQRNVDYLHRMLNAVDNMRSLIDHLLDYSKVSLGVAIWEKVNLNTIISEVINRQELRIEECSARLEIEVLPTIKAVPVLMIQLFDNIIGNALKFKKPDQNPIIKIRSSILDTEEKIKYELPASKNYFQISFADNGIGFENIYADKIFQLFQRLNGRSEYLGSGIGLSICRKITDIHNGLIFPDSKPGIGSTFFIILPESQ